MSISVCPVCNSSTVRVLYPPVVICSGCGLAYTHQSVQGAAQENILVYEKEYFAERNDYITRKTEFTKYFERILSQIQPFQSAGRLLDVGCGPGLLLDVARARGYSVSGCDVSDWAVNYARANGLDVATGELDSIHYPDKNFDVVIINHTLEHVPQPVTLLRETRRILADSGIAVIGVPNFDSLMAHLMRTHWAGLLPDQHLWHFTPRTLQRMLEHSGFSVRQLIVQPSSHQHPDWLKFIVLRCLTTVGNALGRGESMLAIAIKDEPAA